MSRSLGLDNLSVHHTRKTNGIVALSASTVPSHCLSSGRQEIEWDNKTYDVYELLNLSNTFGPDLAHLQAHKGA